MIASMARASCTLDEPRFADAAARAASFVLTEMRRDRRLLRTYRDGKTHTPGYLDDYAFIIDGLLNLYETTFDLKWLTEAERLTEIVTRRFGDPANGGFYFTADDAEHVLVRARMPTTERSRPATRSC